MVQIHEQPLHSQVRTCPLCLLPAWHAIGVRSSLHLKQRVKAVLYELKVLAQVLAIAAIHLQVCKACSCVCAGELPLLRRARV